MRLNLQLMNGGTSKRPPKPTLYKNAEFAGVAAPDTPPDGHEVASISDNQEWGVIDIGNGFNKIEINPNLASNRSVISYSMHQHDSELEVGATYRFSYQVYRHTDSGNNAASLLVTNDAIGWEPSDGDVQDTRVSLGESKRIFIDFIVLADSFSGVIRFGNGLTTSNSGHIDFWYPRLEKITEAPLL
ncbi:hypothetical protein IS519_21620 [Vibrio crassostreae]|uniref:hypothetical protein n=1 Tax=Vibrio crassostreae TaxID=246167 RepID=UPI00200A67FA|nr:hypothetical protein [Vibrio crassostreae]UPR31460.1 hypothetical protein IS519_21620 [Vibrio crassostreae]